MTTAPLELVMIEFPGNRFRGDVVSALADLVERDVIEIVDGLLVVKDDEGTITLVELEQADEDEGLGALVGDPNALVAEDDVFELADALAPNSSAAILLFEHTWARSLADAIRGADGELRCSMRIPGAVVDEVLNARAEVG